jgi:hypothetical protein
MRILLLILFFCILAGCRSAISTTTIDDSNVIVAKLGQINNDAVDISGFIDSVEFVKLETSPNSLIAEITRVVLVDSLIIVVDGRMNRLLAFDHNGKHLYNIAKLGRGPGEYHEITKVMWDNDKRELALYDIASRKLLFYTVNGQFLRSIDDFNGRSVIRDIIADENGGYLCYREDRSDGPTGTDNLSGLWTVDSLGGFERFLIDRTTIYPSVSSQFEFSLYPLDDYGYTGVVDPYSADIYHTDGQTISKFLTYDVPGKKIIDFPGLATKHDVDEPFFHLINHTEKGNMVLSEWLDPDEKYFASLYSKSDRSFYAGRGTVFKFDGGWVPVSMNASTNIPLIMASALQSSMILGVIDSPHIPDNMKEYMKHLVEGMSRDQIEEMNPVLILLHIKKS